MLQIIAYSGRLIASISTISMTALCLVILKMIDTANEVRCIILFSRPMRSTSVFCCVTAIL